MKKLLSGILVLLIVFCFVSCGVSTNENEADINYEQDVGDENTTLNESIIEPVAPSTPKCIECGSECETGHSYCSLCGCWESGCLLPQKDMSVYCVNHSCLLCTSARSYNSPYCSRHKCNSCENAVVGGSDYCVAHKCLICDSKIFGNSKYCGTHK